MHTVCYDLHFMHVQCIEGVHSPWELNLWPLCCWHSSWPCCNKPMNMNINRVLWFRTHKGFSHLKWVNLGQSKPWINGILHSLFSRFTLLRIYPGLTINPGYPYIGICGVSVIVWTLYIANLQKHTIEFPNTGDWVSVAKYLAITF